jgi:hypothetical protein
MTPVQWLERINSLAERFSEYGIGPDLSGRGIADLCGMLRLLKRAALEASHGPTA